MLQGLIHKSLRFVKKHSTTILTCVGAAGVAATVALAVKSTIKAVRIVDKAEEEKGEPLTKVEIVKETVLSYIPTLILGAATISCIFGANILNKKRQATIMSAYLFIDSAYKEYQKKVRELYGDEADSQIRNAIVRDKYAEYHRPITDINPDFYENQLFYEEHYGILFERTKEQVLEAEYELNREFAIDGWSSMGQFYRLLGLDLPRHGELHGWVSCTDDEFFGNRAPWLDFRHEYVAMSDGMECCVISISPEPSIEY